MGPWNWMLASLFHIDRNSFGDWIPFLQSVQLRLILVELIPICLQWQVWSIIDTILARLFLPENSQMESRKNQCRLCHHLLFKMWFCSDPDTLIKSSCNAIDDYRRQRSIFNWAGSEWVQRPSAYCQSIKSLLCLGCVIECYYAVQTSGWKYSYTPPDWYTSTFIFYPFSPPPHLFVFGFFL